MGPVGRFTKDRVSPAVWWPLAIVLLGLFAVTFPAEEWARRGHTLGSAWFVDLPQAWVWYRWAVGIAAGIVLLLALLSLRRSVAKIGAGVPFYPSSLPEGEVLVDETLLILLQGNEEGASHANDRIANLERRLRESETDRLETEGELQRLLAERAEPEPEPDRTNEAAPEPLRAATDVVPVPDIDPQPEPQGASGWPEVVVLPTAASTKSASPPPGESAVDMLNRMVEPVETPAASNDPSLLRSKLARTAALKKPGSRERRDEADPPLQP